MSRSYYEKPERLRHEHRPNRPPEDLAEPMKSPVGCVAVAIVFSVAISAAVIYAGVAYLLTQLFK